MWGLVVGSVYLGLWGGSGGLQSGPTFCPLSASWSTKIRASCHGSQSLPLLKLPYHNGPSTESQNKTSNLIKGKAAESGKTTNPLFSKWGQEIWRPHEISTVSATGCLMGAHGSLPSKLTWRALTRSPPRHSPAVHVPSSQLIPVPVRP